MDATTSTSTTLATQIPFSNVQSIFSSLGQYEWLAWLLTFDGVFSVLSVLWSTYAILAYLVVMVFLYLYVFASVRIQQLEAEKSDRLRLQERLWNEQFRGVPGNSRLQDIAVHIDSDRPNDWKLAIIEADVMLDEVLKQQGYGGESLGERLRMITPTQLQSIEDAWAAHKVRNQVAHRGPDFVLTKRLAEETIKQYRRVLSELGVQ
jgi:hypothetical protein